MRGASPRHGWRQTGDRDEVRMGFSTKAIRLFGELEGRIHVKDVEKANSRHSWGPSELRREYGRLVMLLDNASYHEYMWGRRFH